MHLQSMRKLVGQDTFCFPFGLAINSLMHHVNRFIINTIKCVYIIKGLYDELLKIIRPNLGVSKPFATNSLS